MVCCCCLRIESGLMSGRTKKNKKKVYRVALSTGSMSVLGVNLS